jgi:glycosyltransferase involved in cell wall biosynthesis
MDTNKTIQSAFNNYKEGNLRQAANTLFSILEEQPGNSDVLLPLAAICSELNNHDLAMQCIDSVLKSCKHINIFNSRLNFFGKRNFQETISLCMIVKNEENNLIKCLIHAKPLVNEMIIIDTGSTDRTKDIAQAFGAKIYDFQWTDDYSQARNFSLSKATGRWILVLDADEVISFVDHDSLRDLIERSSSEFLAYQFIIRNYIISMNVGWTANDGRYREEAGTGWFPSMTVRLFPNDSRICFENSVHEFVYSSLSQLGVMIRNCTIPIHHYGNLNSVKNFKKGKKYYRIGKQKISGECGQDITAYEEIAVQAAALGKYGEALEYWQNVLAIKPKSVRALHGIGNAYFQLGRYRDALSYLNEAIKLVPNLRETLLLYANCQIFLGNAESAVLILEALAKEDSTYPVIMIMLAIAYFCARRMTEGLKIMHESKNIHFMFSAFLNDFAKKLLDTQQFEYAILILEAAVENNYANSDTSNLLAQSYKLKLSETK